MAETAVSFLLDQLSALLREEGKLLGGLRQDIQDIKHELEHMRAFLKVAEGKEEDDPRLQEWIRQVREVAYDTEDILDEFVLRFASSHHDGFVGFICKIFSCIKNLHARHRIASEVQQIKKRTTNIYERHQRYQSEYGTTNQVSECVASKKEWRFDGDDALLVEEAKLVGIDGPKTLLISKLIDNNPQLVVVSVLGMGGLGKTTLVRRVFEDVEIRRDFQVCAWITVSQSVCEVENLIKDLIEQVCREIKKPTPQEINSMRSNELKMYLRNLLQGKRYVIVFDDVWDTDIWNNMKFALPEGGCGNRIILTTRKSDVASAPLIESNGYLHKMEPLPFDDAWTLFCRKTFEDHNCPSHLKQVCESILGKCEGLPLAIIAISGLLALKDKNNLNEWAKVQRSLGTEFEGSGKLDRIKRILSLSYNDLPHYLKTCVLYFSIFPEDDLISCSLLKRLWIAERFVQEKGGMSAEEIAEECLRELIGRSLIQVIKAFSDGEPTTCRIHDLLREFLISKSRELNLMTIGTTQNMRWPEKIRRLAIHSYMDSSLQLQEGNYYFKHLRSLITFGFVESLSKSPFIDKILYGGSRLLKILDLSGSELDKIPEEVFNLFHLRYLSFRNTKVEKVSKAIGKLKKLEYLDLTQTSVSELPKEILELHNLRQLLVYRQAGYLEDFKVEGFKAPHKFGGLRCLQWLAGIATDSNSKVREIGELTQLRRLCITNLRNEDGKEFCSSLKRLKNLILLNVSSIKRDEILDLNHNLGPSSLQFLGRLCLRGPMVKVPQWIPSSQSLTEIELVWSELMDDPLESFQHLPNLMNLQLKQAYQGEGLCFKAGGFLKLKKLLLGKLREVKCVRVEEGAMPNLQELFLYELKLLVELPCGIQHLSNLKLMSLNDMSDYFIEMLLDETSQERTKVAHVPTVRIACYIADERWQVHYL